MGVSLNGLTPAATYSGLIKFGDNSVIGAALKVVSDGAGNDTPLYISSTQINVGGGTINARLGVKGTGTTSATTSFRVENSDGSRYLNFKDNGLMEIYDPTTARTGSWDGYNLTAWRVGRFGASGGINFDGEFALRDETNATNLIIAGSTSRFLKNLGINTAGANNASAALQIDSTTKGVLFPRMTTAQKNAIATPAAGLVVFDTSLSKLCVYSGTAWETITSV